MTTRWDGWPTVNPSRDGWHWLRFGKLMPAFWHADKGEWSQGGLVCGGSCRPKFLASDHFQGGVEYVAPCEIPE